MRLLVGLVCLLASGMAVASGPGYINSRGELVELTPAADRVVIMPASGVVELHLITRSQLVSSAARRLSNGMLQFKLEPALWGKATHVLAKMKSAGLIARSGMVFVVPGTERVFSLDREVIVKLRGRAGDDIGPQLAACGLVLADTLNADGSTVLMRAADSQQALDGARCAASLSGVQWALPDFLVPITLYEKPTDPYYHQQWYLNQETPAHIGAEEAWKVTPGDPQVVVAVIDTGVDTDHPDFAPERVLPGYNSQTDTANPAPGATSIDAHGTACSGVIVSAMNNDEGLVGVCPNCTLMPIKMMDGATDETQISLGYRSLNYAAENGAWVLSNSWGVESSYYMQVDLQPYYDAVDNALENGREGQGSVVLFAAGNGNMLGMAEPISEEELANLPGIMAVGGTDFDDLRVPYSDYGDNLSIVAPTGGIMPDDGDFRTGIFTTDTLGDRGFSRDGFLWMPNLWGGDQKSDIVEPDKTGNYHAFFNGTSAACPIAAGVVGLVFSANPNLTGPQARHVVEMTANRVGDQAYDADGWNQYYGNGRVNAARAVRVATFGLENPDGATCADDFNCAGGKCYKADEADLVGVCADGCQSEAECDEGLVCAPIPAGFSVCLPACEEHVECQDGSVCTAGACRPVDCAEDETCPEGTACLVDGPDRRCRMVCADDAGCDEPALCLAAEGGDLCRAVTCDAENSCPEGTVCSPDQGMCVRPCADDAGCVSPDLCLPTDGGDVCQTIECDSMHPCPTGSTCQPEDEVCIRPCGSDTECQEPALCLPAIDGDVCQAVACEAGCPTGSACTQDGEYCQRPCAADEECQAPSLCLPGEGGDVCQSLECDGDKDCPEETECGRGGTCQRPEEGGSSGCASTGGHPGLAGLWLMLGLMLAWRRRT